jgi:hypothetical protein
MRLTLDVCESSFRMVARMWMCNFGLQFRWIQHVYILDMSVVRGSACESVSLVGFVSLRIFSLLPIGTTICGFVRTCIVVSA